MSRRAPHPPGTLAYQKWREQQARIASFADQRKVRAHKPASSDVAPMPECPTPKSRRCAATSAT